MYHILGYFQGIFVNFAFLVLVVKINSMKMLLCRTFLCVHVGHLQEYFLRMFNLGKIRKFSTSKITGYTVHSLMV